MRGRVSPRKRYLQQAIGRSAMDHSCPGDGWDYFIMNPFSRKIIYMYSNKGY